MHLNLKPPCHRSCSSAVKHPLCAVGFESLLSCPPAQKFKECLNWICQSLLGLACTWRWGGKGQYPEMTSKQCGMWLQTSICSPRDLPWAQSQSCAPAPLQNQQEKEQEGMLELQKNTRVFRVLVLLLHKQHVQSICVYISWGTRLNQDLIMQKYSMHFMHLAQIWEWCWVQLKLRKKKGN